MSRRLSAEGLARLPGAGAIGAMIAAPDWGKACPLGPPAAWPQPLVDTMALILPSRAEIVLFWGEAFIAFYNDAYSPTIGDKHPRALGRPAEENWRELWDDLAPLLRRVRDTGETIAAKDRPFYIERHGGAGETVYFDISYSPVPLADGSIGGVLCVVGETTQRVRARADLAASEARLREETRALEILNRTAGQIAAERDLDRLATCIVEAGCAITGAPFGAFLPHLASETHGLARRGLSDERFALLRAAAALAPITRRGGVPARCDDLHQPPADAQAAALRALAPLELGARSLLWVPVVARSGDRLGVLLFGDPAPGRFDARAERLVAALAAQGAIGIDNARLVAATQRTNRELEAEVARRTVERDRIWQVSRDLLGVASFEGVWLAVNPAWTRVLGWCEADIVGQPTSRFVHPDDLAATRAEIEKLVDGGESHGFENRFRHRDGAYRHLSWSAVAAAGELYAVARDVTEEKAQEAALAETEAALRQAQKMETLGQLTGGVAHDFNNLLQIVLGNLDMLRRHLPAEAGPRLARAVESATTGAQRAATLTQRLLAFARRQPLAPKAIDANQLILGMADLLRRTLGETITLDLALARELWTIEADPNQLETAMLNLAVNARDAMAGGGRLGIRSENRTIDAAEAADLPGVRPGCHVVLAIEDSGTGMDATVLARIFEPFFTTKDVGHGTGLGLSMVYGFVKQSGGAVLVDSEPGRGTVVRLLFPRHQGAAAVPAARADPPAMPRGAGETILVCEDDAEVRATSAQALAELGYRVLEAEDGAGACRLLADPAERIDLLFTDVVLPGGMTGADVAAEAQRHRPAIRTLFTTGYARDAIVHHGRLDAGVALLAKPFGFAELAQRIHALLAGA